MLHGPGDLLDRLLLNRGALGDCVHGLHGPVFAVVRSPLVEAALQYGGVTASGNPPYDVRRCAIRRPCLPQKSLLNSAL